jgi:hypothetical protein
MPDNIQSRSKRLNIIFVAHRRRAIAQNITTAGGTYTKRRRTARSERYDIKQFGDSDISVNKHIVFAGAAS